MIFGRKGKTESSPPVYRPRVIESERLRLVAADRTLVEADLAQNDALGALLGAAVPENWPPELYDREAMRYALNHLEDAGERGWSFWYLLVIADGRDELVGICGFKGRPDPLGSVEIGYSMLRQYRNQGYASEAVDRLIRWAFNHHHVVEVSAETFPHLKPSIRVMQKNGFIHTGPGSERGVVRYAVSRPDRR
ncbi:GNAT family N-acetyltransferase [Elongatibacter sediminis]|uniref:GNAT family N-acetyltransferase n=1 Tax=Elongatibacter sediminis TaxID=3119006 RepID=A0AAW9RJI6_9GAMM